MHNVYGDFELGMECVLSWEEYLLHCGNFEGFWDWGDAREVELIVMVDLALIFCPMFEVEPCWNNKVNLCGDSVVEYEMPTT